jgi:hypothetical protein
MKNKNSLRQNHLSVISDLTIQYLQSLNYLKVDPTMADIERAHIQFYIDQVADTYGQQGNGKKRGTKNM